MLNKAAVRSLQSDVKGRVIYPGDSQYDAARTVWNGMVDRRPAVIVQCENVDDIVAAVTFARDQGAPLSIKGGGHSVAGRAVCDDGVMIDLSAMRAVTVDPAARTARVQPGATLADLDRATQEHGLAVPAGIVSRTGVAGLTLGGGFGYLARKFGLTIDNLISADIVTAGGELVHVNEAENADLLWGLRGGGGNFGVVTSFEYRAHEVGPEVLAGQIFYPWRDADNLLRAYRDLMAEAPDELSCHTVAVNVPPAPPFPEAYHGKTALALLVCYTGDIEEGKRLLAPVTGLAEPILRVLEAMPFTSVQQSLDPGMPDGARYFWKSHFMKEISDEAIETFLNNVEPVPGALSIVGFEPLGGAVSRVQPGATAFPHRDASYALGLWMGWTDPQQDDQIIAWARKFHELMAPYATGGMYTNYLDRDDEGRSQAAYGPNHERLRRLKAKYDPDNLFRLNQNIEPKL